MATFTGGSGEIYIIADKPFAGGGEGDIFDVIGNPTHVAKVYKPDKRTTGRERKLSAMVKINPNVIEQYSWPLDVLYENCGFAGYIMPKVVGKEKLRNIYVYDKRKGNPWTLYIAIAKNLSAAVYYVHEIGQVIGDLNPENILVYPKTGLVTLVDTDSYHIVDQNGNVHRCGVGMPEYVAPELQGKHFPSASLPTFTKDTDLFSLSVLIFSLLMNGAHPFACKTISGSSSKFQPIDNLASGTCAYFNESSSPNIDIPRYAPSMESLPQELQSLFKRAFVDGHKNPKLRPAAEEYYSVLETLENHIKVCTANSEHLYYDNGNYGVSCPWCKVDQKMRAIGQSVFAAGAIPSASGSKTRTPTLPVHPQGYVFRPGTATPPVKSNSWWKPLVGIAAVIVVIIIIVNSFGGKQASKVGSYTLNIGQQKNIVDISSDGIVTDSIQFTIPDELPTFEIESVAANNFSEVEFTFSQPIDEASVVKDNIRIDGSKLTGIDKAYVVDEYGDGAILRVFVRNGFVAAQNERREVSLTGVKAANGTVMTGFVQGVTFRDSTAPSIEQVVAKVNQQGNSRLDIYLSEPLQDTVDVNSLSNYKINGRSILGTEPSYWLDYDDTGRIISIEKSNEVLAAGSYELTINGNNLRFLDYAGNNMGYQRSTFEIADDWDTYRDSYNYFQGPLVEEVLNPVYPAEVKIQFNEEVTEDVKIYWNDGSSKNVSDSVDIDGNVATFKFTSTTYLPFRATTIYLEDCKDYSGNAAHAPTSFEVTAVPDGVRPEIIDYGSEKEQAFWVKFSESVTLIAGEWTIRDSDDDRVYDVSCAIDADDDQIINFYPTTAAAASLPADTYMVTLKGFSDSALPAANKILDVTIEVTVPDTHG